MLQEGFVNACRTRFAQTWHTSTHPLSRRYGSKIGWSNEKKQWIGELRELFFSPKLDDVYVNEAISLKYGYIPTKLFKYREFNEYSLDNLKNNTLWCASANGFNDPYDTSIHFEYSKEILDRQLIHSIEEQAKDGQFKFLTDSEINELKQSAEPTRYLAHIAHKKQKEDSLRNSCSSS